MRGAEPLVRWRIATDDRRTADEYMVWLDQLLRLEGLDRGEIDAVIISTVVPRALHNLQLLADKYFGVEALVARSEEHTSELQSLMRISYAVFCLKKKKTT